MLIMFLEELLWTWLKKQEKNLLVRLHFIVTDCNFQSNEAFA